MCVSHDLDFAANGEVSIEERELHRPRPDEVGRNETPAPDLIDDVLTTRLVVSCGDERTPHDGDREIPEQPQDEHRDNAQKQSAERPLARRMRGLRR